LPDALVATVEFFERVRCPHLGGPQSDELYIFPPQDSVPAALTKDKKRIRGEEVAVHLAWKSTLYVTNFAEKADDKFMRDLFGKVIQASTITKNKMLTLLSSSGLSSMFGGRAKSSRIPDDFAMFSTLLR
jgi:hypothetical protein